MMMNTELTNTEKNKFNDQIAGEKIVSIGGIITPSGAEIIAARNDKKTEEITRGIISILCGNDDVDSQFDDNDGRVENRYTRE